MTLDGLTRRINKSITAQSEDGPGVALTVGFKWSGILYFGFDRKPVTRTEVHNAIAEAVEELLDSSYTLDLIDLKEE